MAQEKERVIVTQNQLGWIQNYTRQIGVNLTIKETVAICNVMVDYCMNGYSTEIGKRLDAVDKFIIEKFEQNA